MKKLHIHNFAGMRDARYIEQNKSILLELLAPVLRRKRYAGLIKVSSSIHCDGIYQVIFSLPMIKDGDKDVYYITSALRLPILEFIQAMTAAGPRIKTRWGTTFMYECPECIGIMENQTVFDSKTITFTIISYSNETTNRHGGDVPPKV